MNVADIYVWFTRELVTIFLVIFLVKPAHAVSDWVWAFLRRRKVTVPIYLRLEIFVFLAVLQLSIIAYYYLIYSNK
jgi:hypothetical protein